MYVDTDNGSAAVVAVAIVGALVFALLVMASWCLYQHKGINTINPVNRILLFYFFL